jgi:tetratricopeptide (TPR) repeat protein
MPRPRKKAKPKKADKKPIHEAGEDSEKAKAPEAFSRVEAADAACLVGEMHLQKGDYEKAIEAFTRAIENNPTPDAYQGRALAYRALADRDQRMALEVRGG